jgi:hypothetical protein
MKLYPKWRTYTRAAVVACLLELIALPTQAAAQINLQGIVSPQGILNISTTTSSATQTHQYTHIWAFAPPNGTGGSGANDNVNFVTDVLTPSTIPIDGVTLLEAWNSIEKAAPTSVPCPTSDVCQPDPGAPWMYHTYDWGTYDSTASGNPVYQWLQLSGKKINLLITGEASGATNPITPHYVTSPTWYDLFNPQTQDVINGIKDCAGPPFGGTSGSSVTASIVGSTVQVVDTNNCCTTSTTSQTSAIQDQDLVWVSTSPTACGTGGTGTTAATASVSSSTTFTYPLPGGCSGSISNITYIGVSQSWAVPYEYPYKNALKAYWAAVVAHYGPNFTLSGTNYYPNLNYFRFGGSVGSEWYPYCVSGMNGGVNVGLKYLSSPYIYVKSGTDANHVGWLDYYQEMGNYLQSLGPPFQIIHSINAAETPPDYTYGNSEAGYAIGWSNRFGIRDGFGSQGLSAQDYINCTSPNNCDTPLPDPSPNSASNWHPMFKEYNTYGAPLELQPIALSYPGDTTCSHGCSVSTFSGDLPTFLSTFATSVGATDFEIYWRDLSLSYDVNHYCALNPGPIPPANTECVAGTSATTGGQLSTGQQFTFFQLVGQGNTPADCGSNMPQSGATGTCAYATNIGQGHGQH